MPNEQNRQNNSNWLPWVLLGLAVLALAGFLLFGGSDEEPAPVEKPSYVISNQNGNLDIAVKTPTADFSYKSDEVAQVKESARETISYERAEKKRAQDELKEYRERVGSGQNSLLKQIVEEQRKTNETLSSVNVRVGNLEEGMKTLNNNVVAGFNTVNTNLVSIDKTIKDEGEKTRFAVREGILSLQHGEYQSSRIVDDPEYGSGYNRSQKR